MSFSEEQIKPLVLFKNIAVKLNRCELVILNSHKDSQNGFIITTYGPVNFDYFFSQLKEVFLEIDLIVEKKLETGIEEELYKELEYNVKNLDFNIASNLDNNFSLEKFFIDLYIFLNKILDEDSKFSSFIGFTNLKNESYDFYKTLKKIVSRKEFNNSEYYRDLISRFNKIDKIIKELSSSSNINYSEFKKELDDFFSNQRIVFEQRANETINLFNSEITTLKNNYKDDLVTKIDDLKEQIDESKNEVNNLDQAITSYKSTVSTKIQNEISKHYQKKATMEMRTYWGATIFSIILILGSLGLLAWGLIDYYHDYISTNVCLKDEAFNACVSRLEKVRDITKNIGITFFVMRFSFSLLLFLTVIYTSRIAIRAYSHWRHSENMHLKLSSLEPFITELPKEVRHEIHRELIPDYFGKDAGLVETANEKFKDLPANVSAVAMKAIEQISGSGGSSSTEKNNKKPESETR